MRVGIIIAGVLVLGFLINACAPVNDQKKSKEPIFCPADQQECPDGSSVSRDPNNNCQFFPCPTDKNFVCITDDDCVKVARGCCNCYQGGKAIALTKKAAQEWEARLATQCREVACPGVISNDPSCFAQPKCVNNQCVLTSENENRENNCATYRRDGKAEEHCATCGNGVCEEFENCTPSTCSSQSGDMPTGRCTSDCGPLYCRKDCE